MVGRLFYQRLVLAKHFKFTAGNRTIATSQSVLGGYGANHGGEVSLVKTKIGNREIVGFGVNGEESYFDDPHYPFPAIRFKEDTPEIVNLRKKEQGDWKKLTLHEKKELYRASFCQTLAENVAPTGEWKNVLGISFLIVAIGLWGFYWMKVYGKQKYFP